MYTYIYIFISHVKGVGLTSYRWVGHPLSLSLSLLIVVVMVSFFYVIAVSKISCATTAERKDTVPVPVVAKRTSNLNNVTNGDACTLRMC